MSITQGNSFIWTTTTALVKQRTNFTIVQSFFVFCFLGGGFPAGFFFFSIKLSTSGGGGGLLYFDLCVSGGQMQCFLGF